MKEEITIDATAGPLEILGGERESALLLNGVPIQFTYLREIGTTQRYLIGKSISEEALIQEAKFQDFVRYGLVTMSRSRHNSAILSRSFLLANIIWSQGI